MYVCIIILKHNHYDIMEILGVDTHIRTQDAEEKVSASEY